MGNLSFFTSDDPEDGMVTFRSGPTTGKCAVEVWDDHGTPTISIEPEDDDAPRYAAVFDNMTQFERFVEALNSLNFRLNPNARRS